MSDRPGTGTNTSTGTGTGTGTSTSTLTDDQQTHDTQAPQRDSTTTSSSSSSSSSSTSSSSTSTNTSTSKKSGSLKLLCKQIEHGIRNIKSKEDGKRLISRIHEKCLHDDHMYATKLFEAYAAIVFSQTQEMNRLKVSGVSGQGVISFEGDSAKNDDGQLTDLDDVEFMQEVPGYLYQGTARQIAGWDALHRNIFWVRVAMMVCCLISFSVMVSIPHIYQGKVSSSNLISGPCQMNKQNGEFSYVPYEVVAKAGIFTFIYSFIFLLYYLIPADAQDRKYIPAPPLFFPIRWGKKVLFEHKASSRYVEVFIDALLFVVCLSAAVVSFATIDYSVLFHSQWSTYCVYGDCYTGGCMSDEYECTGCNNGGITCSDGTCPNTDGWCEHDCSDEIRCMDGSCPSQNGECDYGPDWLVYTASGPRDTFYSLNTFVKTYDNVDESCLDHNPVMKIRISLCFFFFAVLLLLMALQISVRSLYLEKMKRDVLSGKKSIPLADDSAHSNGQ